MDRPRSVFHFPTAETEPRETLEWVRRMELVGGIACIGSGIALWSAGWWQWLFIGVGLLGNSPWPGVRMVLRKAERHPELMQSDPERRRSRSQRTWLWLAPAEFVSVVGLSYLLGGLGVAVTSGVLGGLGIALAVWMSSRDDPPQSKPQQ